MGCCASSPDVEGGHVKHNYKRPQWKSDTPMTEAELKAKRAEYWDTQPAYGGNKVVWETLKGALDADHDTMKIMMEAAELIVTKEDMTEIYDPTGMKYELPLYVLSEPTNLIKQ